MKRPSLRALRLLVGGLAALVPAVGVLAAAAAQAPRAPKRTGEQIYRQVCVSCHGEKGEGSKQYAKPLVGDRSVGQLSRFIAQSMPPGRKKTPPADAQLVAAYIHQAFYSPLAQARLRPPRIELSRLTVRQLRNAVADLVGSFGPAGRTVAPPGSDEYGLRGEYSNGGGRGRGGGNRVLERVDPEIRFDFGAGVAVPGQTDPYQFSIRWQGSVLAPETGEYEFVLRTDQAARLWVNNQRQPFIDAYVRSGSDNEYRGTIHLLGGRLHPVRLEFSKGVVGVNNLEKLKLKPAQPASISLEWRPPKQPLQVVPRQFLRPTGAPEVFVLTAPFPADDRSLGYERGASISREWQDAVTEAALETAGHVASRLDELAGTREGSPDRAARAREFCRQFVTRAFRRPLTPEVESSYIDRQFQAAGSDLEAAAKRVVLLTLTSPRFLYREPGTGASDPYDVASRLAFGLWDSLPDAELLRAAGAGELSTREQVSAQAERMMADPRARAKLREFFLQWLKLDQAPELNKDPRRFAGFDAATAADLRLSLELTLDAAVWSDRSDYRELLLSDTIYLNGRLARLYGVNLPPDAPFQPVKLNPEARAGILTHPYVLAAFSYVDNSSPIHRGVLIARNMLGRILQPPMEAFTPLPAELHPNLTTRQRVALQTRPDACVTCHSMINPLGFTLESFDAIGRFRTEENGKPVDTSGSYESAGGQTIRFSGAKDLAGYLARSEEAQAAFVEQLFEHVVKQPLQAYGPDAARQLRERFAANGFHIRKQVVETVVVAAMKQ